MTPQDSVNPQDSTNLADSVAVIPARRGFSVSYRGKSLLSKIDPVAQGERLAAGIPVKEKTLYFCPSPLYGYGLSSLIERLPNNSAALCVEADERLFEISRNALGEDTSSRVLIRAAEPGAVSAFVRETWGKRVFRRVEVIRLSGGWQIFPRLYEDLVQALRREIALEWGNALTLIHLGRLYARNLIRNVALLPKSENIAALSFASSPVLVLGAGPSLDSVLEELARLCGGKIPAPEERRFKIVCVDTCLPALNDREIQPDLVVILESQHWNLRDFSGSRGKKIDAALDLSALPASVRVLKGRRYFFSTPWTELALLRRLEEAALVPETFAPLGSVGLSAVAVALRISSGPVITGGIDFSYTMDAYHARSTPGYRDLARQQNRFRSLLNAGAAFREKAFPVVSKNGKAVRSDPVMRNYRDLFEGEFGGNPRLIDIEGTGLDLGIKTVSAEEAFAVLRGGAAPGGGTPPDGLPNGVSGPVSREPRAAADREKLAAFIRGEIKILVELKETLSGAAAPGHARVEELLDVADYLWAHFPECAGAGGRRPPATDTSFLKRVRTEIEPFQKLWETAFDDDPVT